MSSKIKAAKEIMNTMTGAAIHEAILEAGDRPWADRKRKEDRAAQLAELVKAGKIELVTVDPEAETREEKARKKEAAKVRKAKKDAANKAVADKAAALLTPETMSNGKLYQEISKAASQCQTLIESAKDTGRHYSQQSKDAAKAAKEALKEGEYDKAAKLATQADEYHKAACRATKAANVLNTSMVELAAC